MRTYRNISEIPGPIEEWRPNCRIWAICPTEGDQRKPEGRLQIPDYFLQDVSDTGEHARYEYDDGWTLIILRIPCVKKIHSRTPHATAPLGIIYKYDVTTTVYYYETNMVIDSVSYQQKRDPGFTDYVDLTFRLFLSSAIWYLKRLKQIDTLTGKAKHSLGHEVNNESLTGLSRLQDSLTYLITSVRGNENLLARLKSKLQVDELDANLIEDANIEMTQARETTSIHADVPGSIMGTYSSITNNNVNTAMKTLISVSTLMMSTTLMASLYGMNVVDGMGTYKYGFIVTFGISILVTVVS